MKPLTGLAPFPIRPASPSCWQGDAALRAWTKPKGRRRFCHYAFLLLALAGGLAAAPKETNTAPRQSDRSGQADFTSFKIISDRNIFNANRTRRSAGGEDKKASKVDDLTLVGTLIYEKGPYAFFEGSSSEYRKVLEAGKTIAGYKIGEITGSSVKLEAGTNTVELTVGMKMRREEEGEWEVVGGGGPRGSISSTASTSEGTSNASSPDSAAGGESDIIKRLMQQREQELK